MKSIQKQNFYQGQRVGPGEMNALISYNDKTQGELVSSLLGAGVVHGYGLEIISGFVAGIAPGLAYDAQGRRLILEAGTQVDLAIHAPAVGSTVIRLGVLPELLSDMPAVDSMGESVYTRLTESVAFTHGENLPEGALPLYELQLSPVGIVGFTPIYPLFEAPRAQSARTQGFENAQGALFLRGTSAKFMRPDGFTLDLVEGCLRRTVFDPLHGPYKKGDIIWLEPLTYGTQSTPPAGGGGGVA